MNFPWDTDVQAYKYMQLVSLSSVLLDSKNLHHTLQMAAQDL